MISPTPAVRRSASAGSGRNRSGISIRNISRMDTQTLSQMIAIAVICLCIGTNLGVLLICLLQIHARSGGGR